MSDYLDVPVRDLEAAISAWDALDDVIDQIARTDRRDGVREAARATMVCFDNVTTLAGAVAGSPVGQQLNDALMRLYNELG